MGYFNSKYLKEGKPLIYGLAIDGIYNYHNYDDEHSNPVQAMEVGNFYRSTEVTLESVSFENQTLTVKINPEDGVNYRIQFWGTQEGVK